MQILFVCSANKDRSATAEDYFRSLYPEHEFKSAGTNQKYCKKLGTQYISGRLLKWADRIYVMETKHQQVLLRMNVSGLFNRISVLHIPDHYPYGHVELKKILNQRVIID